MYEFSLNHLIWNLLLLSGVCLQTSLSRPTTKDNINYLATYGYLKESEVKSGDPFSSDKVKMAVKQFQRNFGLRVTGIIDKETQETMELPRCGVKDNIEMENNVRRKRFAIQGSKWLKSTITYNISQYSNQLSILDTERVIQRALEMWSEVVPLTFRHQSSDIDIDIRFAGDQYGEHGDGFPFMSTTLAHAFFPLKGGGTTLPGDVHINEYEQWTIKNSSPNAYSLFWVVAHEIGHSLGLKHSNVTTAYMWPTVSRGYYPEPGLDQDDISGVQAIYGIRIPRICRDASIDAVTTTDDGTTYMFKGENYYRVKHYGKEFVYPWPIHLWGSVRGPVDAAVTWYDGLTYIFKGDYYWTFRNLQMIHGPKNITLEFDGIPGDIDAAFLTDSLAFFVKGNKFWGYSPLLNQTVEDYSGDMAAWRMTENVTAALPWTNGIYFFAGDKYYTYYTRLTNVKRPMENPMDVATDWLGCPEKTEVEAIDREPARNEPSQYNSEINDGNKASDMTLQGSSHGEGRDNDEQLMAVQDKNDVLGQRSVATYQQCGHCLGLGLLAALSVVLLGN